MEAHLMELTYTREGQELQGEDLEEMLMRMHALCALLLARKLPKRLTKEVTELSTDLERVLSWASLH